MGRMIGKLFRRTSKSGVGVGHYDLTYAGCADFLIQRMVAEEPPFDHGEWYIALIQLELPSGGLDAITPGLDAIFEFICWMNSLVVFVSGIIESHGEVSGDLLIGQLEEQLIARLPDAGPSLVMFFRAEFTAPPLPSDHPVFTQKNCEVWAKHTAAFGRAKAALDHVSDIGNISKEEALSLLGRCVGYGTICSSERFSTVIPKIRFVEQSSEHTQTI
jgi:hypothetical protein